MNRSAVGLRMEGPGSLVASADRLDRPGVGRARVGPGVVGQGALDANAEAGEPDGRVEQGAARAAGALVRDVGDIGERGLLVDHDPRSGHSRRGDPGAGPPALAQGSDAHRRRGSGRASCGPRGRASPGGRGRSGPARRTAGRHRAAGCSRRGRGPHTRSSADDRSAGPGGAGPSAARSRPAGSPRPRRAASRGSNDAASSWGPRARASLRSDKRATHLWAVVRLTPCASAALATGQPSSSTRVASSCLPNTLRRAVRWAMRASSGSGC
jgi:hypothetical protein